MAANKSAESRNATVMDLEGDSTIVIRRTFDAPARIVFEAYTNADLVKRWFAPKKRGVTMVSCDADVREGGAYRYVFRPSNGEAVAFSGTYREVKRHTKVVFSQIFEPMRAAGEAVITVTFDEHDGKTTVVGREVYPSAQVRDGVIASGMEDGMRESMEQLDALVTSLA